MSRSMMLVAMLLLLFVCVTAGTAESTALPTECSLCRMKLADFAQNRLIITYADGTGAGACSLRCAIELMSRDREAKTIQVPDYATGVLIDAKTATWVTDGKKPGGMNSPAWWAFEKSEDAQNFIKENGGSLSSFDQVLQAASAKEADSGMADEAHGDHDHHGPGGHLLFNPAFGDDIYHTHPAGMWMANYKYMHMVQRGLRNGTTDVPVENATPVGNKPFGFMMAPTSMTMDMHMVMAMYGLTDRFTLMGMGTYLDNRMEMVMNMGMGNRPDSPMKTSGLGDTELRGIYKINDYLTASLGLSIPTGDINQEFTTMGTKFRAPYDMQLGSGTVDLKPALTYSMLSDDGKWNWGGQAGYTYHVDHNGNGYSLGDSAKVTGWLQRSLGPAATWLRFAYNYSGRINGRDPEIGKLLDPMTGAPTPDADPGNYGGHRFDGFAGVSYAVGPFAIGVEAGIPLYQNLNGLQLKNDWYLTAGVQAMF